MVSTEFDGCTPTFGHLNLTARELRFQCLKIQNSVVGTQSPSWTPGVIVFYRPRFEKGVNS